MKILRLFTALFIAVMTMAACDDTTDNIGSSITNEVDNLSIQQKVFNVTSRSVVSGPVLSRNNTGMIGKVKDPETGTYVTGDYMTQLGVLSSFSLDTLEYIRNAHDGKIEADSCFLLVSYKTIYGDSLAPMKATAYEMSKPMTEDKEYYSDYDAFGNGWVSENNYHSSATYNLNEGSTMAFKIYLNKPYKARDGKTYKNYGTYIMNTFVEHPEYFKSNYRFLNNVCPGFYIKNTGGIGNVANIWNTELQLYWKIQKTVKDSHGNDSIVSGYTYNRFDGTEEVLQLNKITNDTKTLEKLASNEECTFIKSPAGIFTEVTLPVEDIIKGHEKDTLNTASISFPRMNNVDDSKYQFSAPSTVLMVEADSLNAFFEQSKLTDNRSSYTATFSASTSKKNAYTFYNISNLVTKMYNAKLEGEKKNANWVNEHPNWNKVMLVPVTLKTSTINNSTVVTKINHDMSLSSTRLIKATDDANKDYTLDKSGNKIASGPVQIKVIYSRFKE